MKNILVVYYSHSGNTKNMAETIAKQSDATLFEILPQDKYPSAYREVVEQANKEIQAKYRPKLEKNLDSIQQYDTIFVGSPNWWSTIAPPVATFLESLDFSNKVIIPFCTHGGGGFGHLEKDIKDICPKSIVLTGLASY